MPILKGKTPTVSPDRVKKALRWDRTGGQGGSVRELLDRAQPFLEPRALFDTAYITGKSEDGVSFGDVTFISRVLRKNLDAVERAFPYVITIGGGLEREAGRSGDLLEQYSLETLGDLALEEARKELESHIRKLFGLETLSSMSPGSLEDWPITEQRPLFSLLGDVEGLIGVRLTDSLLMIPRKSVSGLLFPSVSTFLSCRLCPRNPCPGRKAAYDTAFRKRYGLAD